MDIKVKQLQGQQQILSAGHSLAVAGGIQSHKIQQGFAFVQANLAFAVARAKAVAGGPPITAPARIAFIAGIFAPILSAIKGSSSGASAGGGFAGGVPLGNGFAPPPGVTPTVPIGPVQPQATGPGTTINLRFDQLDPDTVVATLAPAFDQANKDNRFVTLNVVRGST